MGGGRPRRQERRVTRQRLVEKYVNACIDDESVGEGFVGTIREIVWDTNKAAWIAQIHPTPAASRRATPLASLPALMIKAVQPEGIVVVPGPRDGFVDVELCDEKGSESDDDDASERGRRCWSSPPTQCIPRPRRRLLILGDHAGARAPAKRRNTDFIEMAPGNAAGAGATAIVASILLVP